MRISDTQVKKVLSEDWAAYNHELIGSISKPTGKDTDKDLIRKVTKDVIAMGDREDMIAELKAKIEAGQYNPTSDEIVDAMIRRSIADRLR
jgi:negative regulator of flagellin synthesis FlgM